MGALSFDEGVRIVRYGISADQRYLTGDFVDTYAATMINGNMVAHIPAALAQFLGERASGASGPKPFIIDPQTHAFQHDPSKVRTTRTAEDGHQEEVTKSSVLRMAEAFGEPVRSRVGEQAVLPGHFSADPGRAAEFCRRVIDFQLTTIENQARDKDFWKYLSYLGVTEMRPAAVIAPYFWMTPGTAEQWLPVNTEFIRCASGIVAGVPLFAQLVVSRELLVDEAWRTRLVANYGEAPCDGVFLWVDDFREHDVAKDELSAFAGLARELSTRHKKLVVNLYGGYFSILLCRLPELRLLSGVCHGLEYAEDRSVVPVGGGLPMAKFYMPSHHRRLRYPDAVSIVRELGGFRSVLDYHERVCACPVCTELVTANPALDFAKYGVTFPVTFRRANHFVTLNYPTPETKDYCLRHYLHTKDREFAETARTTALDVSRQLESQHGLAERCLGSSGAQYLLDWAQVVRELGA